MYTGHSSPTSRLVGIIHRNILRRAVRSIDACCCVSVQVALAYKTHGVMTASKKRRRLQREIRLLHNTSLNLKKAAHAQEMRYAISASSQSSRHSLVPKYFSDACTGKTSTRSPPICKPRADSFAALFANIFVFPMCRVRPYLAASAFIWSDIYI